jgi:acetyl-CoA C-acetyltransferase
MEKLSAFPPVFKKDGTITAGTSPRRNDGAAAVLMMTLEKARESWATGLWPAG